jgi:uncharacterized protein (TIGR03118 family)
MQLARQSFARASLIAICAFTSIAAHADDGGDRDARPNRYMLTNLTSDIQGVAPNTDPVLRNAWGVAFSPAASPFWIADNASGCSTLYDGTGAKVMLQVAIPSPDNSVPTTACQPASAQKNPPPPTPAAPTGLVWNPSMNFLVPGTNIPASFILDTEDGTIVAWAGTIPDPSHAVVAVDNSGSGAVYKGLATGVSARGVFLFAANFHAGQLTCSARPTPAAIANTFW